MPETAEVRVSLADVEPVRSLLAAGVQLYAALYHMPGATEFFTKTASPAVCRAYMEMGRTLRTSPLSVAKTGQEEETG